MTDKYIAQGQIRWGPKDAKGKGDVKVFYDGDIVTGPDKEEMDQLIEAGAVIKQSDLQRREAPGEASDMEKAHLAELEAKDKEITALRTRVQELEAKAGGSGQQVSTTGGKPAGTK